MAYKALYKHKHKHTYTHTNTHAHKHTHTHTRKHTHIHTHSPVCAPLPPLLLRRCRMRLSRTDSGMACVCRMRRAPLRQTAASLLTRRASSGPTASTVLTEPTWCKAWCAPSFCCPCHSFPFPSLPFPSLCLSLCLSVSLSVLFLSLCLSLSLSVLSLSLSVSLSLSLFISVLCGAFIHNQL